MVYNQKIPRWQRALDCFCGLSDDIAEEKKTAAEQKKHLAEVTSLKQGRLTKRFLRVGLLITLTVAVFMYIFWSMPDGGPTKPSFVIEYVNKSRDDL